jgi:hypothetical protein
MSGLAEPRDDVRDRVAFLIAEVDGGEPLDGHVDRVTTRGPNAGERLHRRLCLVGPE